MTGKPVVCNASPLIALQQVGLISSLQNIFATLAIPPIETGASRILLDDRPARRLTQALGLAVTGTLEILLACKRKALLPAVKPALVSLLRFGFRVAPDLHDLVLRDAGEND